MKPWLLGTLIVVVLVLLSGCVNQAELELKEKKAELEGCEERATNCEKAYEEQENLFAEIKQELTAEQELVDESIETTQVLSDIIERYRDLLSFYQTGWDEGIKASVITHFIPSFCGYRLISRINSAQYFVFKQKEHPPLDENISVYITYSLPKIEDTLRQIEEVCEPTTSREKAQWILAYVHRIRYESDDDNYTKYPVETLAEGSGDCEDLSILAATLMKAAGLDVVLVLFDDHIGVAVNVDASGQHYNHGGKKYYYAETTGTEWIDQPVTWQIGQIPGDYKDKKATIIPI